jgi:hypothetical protein
MPTLREKNAHLGEMQRKADAYIAAGGDPKSDGATSMWMDYLKALDAVARELGYEILKPVKSRRPDFIRPDPSF